MKCLCIAFRGTEQVKWKDLITDLSFQPAAFNPERVLESGSSHSLLASSDEVYFPNPYLPCCYKRKSSHSASTRFSTRYLAATPTPLVLYS